MKTSMQKYSGSPLATMKREMDRFFDDLTPFWRLENGGIGMDIWAPDTDMSETENEYVVMVDLPGMSKKDIKINYQDNRLTISGERKKKKKKKAKIISEERDITALSPEPSLCRQVSKKMTLRLDSKMAY